MIRVDESVRGGSGAGRADDIFHGLSVTRACIEADENARFLCLLPWNMAIQERLTLHSDAAEGHVSRMVGRRIFGLEVWDRTQT